MSDHSLLDVARAASVIAVLALLAVLAYYLPAPGGGPSRLYLFALIGTVGVAGALGVALGWPTLIGASGVGIFLLGFWQAVLGVVMLPVAALLFSTAILVHGSAGDGEPGSSREPRSAS